VPAGISEAIQANLLADLQQHLVQYLNTSPERRLSRDSSGATSDHSSDPGDLPPARVGTSKFWKAAMQAQSLNMITQTG
jgi:hypothetical protein